VRASERTARPKPAKPKIVTICTAEARDAEGKAVRDPGSITYSAAIESAATRDICPELSPFAARVLRQANRRGFSEAARCVVLGDGSPWIWNTATELFPPATQILDRFHAKEHLSKVGKAIHGDSTEGKQCIQSRYDELDDGHLKSLAQALHDHARQYPEARECIHYIWNNRRRMRYPKYHHQSLYTSTGVVEAGCKVVIGTRLKRAGRHWTVKGANAIIALRCSKLSGRFEDFWERRSEHKHAAHDFIPQILCAAPLRRVSMRISSDREE
jgi:transposase